MSNRQIHRSVVARGLGRGEREFDSGHDDSVWDEEKTLEIAMIVTQHVYVPNVTELYGLKSIFYHNFFKIVDSYYKIYY